MLTENQLALWRAIDANNEPESIEALQDLDSVEFMVNLGAREGLIPCISFIITHHLNQLLEMVLIKGADLTAKDTKQGNSALHFAAKTGNIVAIALLVKHGADKRALNKQNQTPLQLLASAASPKAKKLLSTIPSLQSLCSVKLGEAPQGVPLHLEELQATFVQQYHMRLKQQHENQQTIEQLSKAVSCLHFLSPS